jgi:hypothetical protein
LYVRQDRAIAFDWYTYGPGGGMPTTDFSVRWVRTEDLAGGRYRFYATVDDGVRITVDDRVVIDNFYREGPAQGVWGEIDLAHGRHTIRVEYRQLGGVAVIGVGYSRVY